MATIGQTQYYQNNTNGETYYSAQPYAGNDPYGYTPIDQNAYISGLQGKISQAQATKSQLVQQNGQWQYANGSPYSGTIPSDSYIAGLQSQLNDVQAKTGIHAPGYSAPGYYAGVKTADNPVGLYSDPNSAANPMPNTPEAVAAAIKAGIAPGSAGAQLQAGLANGTVSPTNPAQQYAASLTGNNVNAPGITAVDPNVIQNAYNATVASGAKAPQTSGEALSTVGSAIKGATPPSAMANPIKVAQTQIEQSPEYQQFMADKAALDKVQATSQVDFINKALQTFGIKDIDTQLLNNEKIINGTEDDIRNEVQATGGFATNSQVLALATARNKSLIQQDAVLSQQKSDALAMVDRLSSAFTNDQQTARQAMMDKLNIDQQALDLRSKMISATQEGYKNIINATGYSGFVSSLLNTDPTGQSLQYAEQSLGFAPGQLQQIATQEKSAGNLAVIQAAGATSPYVVNSNGEVWNTQTGYAYTSPQDFQQKTGQPLQTAIASGAITKLGLPIEQQTKIAQMQKAQVDAQYAGALNQANLNQSNASAASSAASAAKTRSELAFEQANGGLTPDQVNKQQADIESATQKINSDASGYVEKLAGNKIKWNDAFNAFKALHPELSIQAIDNLLQSNNYRP